MKSKKLKQVVRWLIAFSLIMIPGAQANNPHVIKERSNPEWAANWSQRHIGVELNPAETTVGLDENHRPAIAAESTAPHDLSSSVSHDAGRTELASSRRSHYGTSRV